MATTLWVGNQRLQAQVVTVAVTAVANGATLTATINTKAVVYTCTATDTTTTAATGWFQALQAASSIIPEFGELSFGNATAGSVTFTASVPGTPFTLTTAAAGGATRTQTTTAANLSPSDVNDPLNWLRSGANSLPQNGDDVVLKNSTVPLLWNLSSLAAVQFATFTRWQNFTGQIGLPVNNPLGYREYRPTYFQFTGSGTLTMLLGAGPDVGAGPPLERYDLQSQRTNLTVLASGSASQNSSVYFLSTNINNTLSLVNTSLESATESGEATTFASAVIDDGATLTLGPGVTFTGTLTATGSTLDLFAAPASLVANNCQITLLQDGLTWASIQATNGTSLSVLCGGTITSLTLATASSLDKSQDLRALTMTNATIDGDTCQIIDPLNKVTFSNPVSVKNPVTSGPFVFNGTRTVLVT